MLGAEQRVTHRGSLTGPSSVVDPAPVANRGNRLDPGQRCYQNRCRSGISDSHVARNQQIGAPVDFLVGDLAAGVDRVTGLLLGERVLGGDVAAASSNLVGADLG